MIPLKILQMQGASFPRNEAVLAVRRSDEEIEATQQMEHFERNNLYFCNLLDGCLFTAVFQPVLKKGLLLLLKYLLGNYIFLCSEAANICIFLFLECQDIKVVSAFRYFIRIGLPFMQ